MITTRPVKLTAAVFDYFNEILILKFILIINLHFLIKSFSALTIKADSASILLERDLRDRNFVTQKFRTSSPDKSNKTSKNTKGSHLTKVLVENFIKFIEL